MPLRQSLHLILHPSERPSRTHPEFTRRQVAALKRTHFAPRQPPIDFPADTVWTTETITPSERRESEERREIERREERKQRLESMREVWECRAEWDGEAESGLSRGEWEREFLGVLSSCDIGDEKLSVATRRSGRIKKLFRKSGGKRQRDDETEVSVSARCEEIGSHLIARVRTSMPVRVSRQGTRIRCCRHASVSTQLVDACTSVMDCRHRRPSAFLTCEGCQSLYEIRHLDVRKDSGVGFGMNAEDEDKRSLMGGREEKEMQENMLVVDVWVDMGCLADAKTLESVEVEALRRKSEGERLVGVDG